LSSHEMSKEHHTIQDRRKGLREAFVRLRTEEGKMVRNRILVFIVFTASFVTASSGADAGGKPKIGWPQSTQEVLFPICWGHPQDCRDAPATTQAPAPTSVPGPTFTVVFRVRCVDVITGADRADDTLSVTSKVSRQTAVNQVLRQYNTSDLCQANGDQTRRMLRGSGVWL
jgi:hypothetical protein